MNRKFFALLLCLALCFSVLPMAARGGFVGYTVSAAVSGEDRNAATEALDVLPGDTITVIVSVNGESFFGAACRLTYDADRFALDTVPEPWEQSSNILSYFDVNSTNDYYATGTVLGTFTFRVKSAAAAGSGSFTLSDSYVASDWYEGHSTVPAEECDTSDASANVLAAKVVQKETTEYVAGHSLVLVYTDDGTAPYAYNGAAMYDVSAAGYLYDNLISYAHVYALVIQGAANLSKATATAASVAGTLTYFYDVDASGTVEQADAVAVQTVYNTSAMADMLVVLRADVNADKTLDILDAALIFRQLD